LLQDGVDCLSVFWFACISLVETKYSLDLISRDAARAVLVEQFEGSLKEFVGLEIFAVDSCDDEFSIINESGLVGVDCVKHSFDFFIGHDLSVVVKVALLDFVH
jgi:hypothetical protein